MLEIEKYLIKIAYPIDIKNVKYFESKGVILYEDLHLEMSKDEYDRVS